DLHRHVAHRAERAVVDLELVEVEHHRRLRQRDRGRLLDLDPLGGGAARTGLGARRFHHILHGHRHRHRHRHSGHHLWLATRAVKMRATSVTRNVSRTSVSAAPHARSCAATNDEFALAKICTDSAVFASPNRLRLYSVAAPTATGGGAAAPAARATARSAPDTIPGSAAGSTTVKMVRLLVVPRA